MELTYPQPLSCLHLNQINWNWASYLEILILEQWTQVIAIFSEIHYDITPQPLLQDSYEGLRDISKDKR